jgi:hypothetical protein
VAPGSAATAGLARKTNRYGPHNNNSAYACKTRERARLEPGPLSVRSTWCYATRATPLLCATTLPVVIFGAFGIADVKFSSVIHLATILVDSSA